MLEEKAQDKNYMLRVILDDSTLEQLEQAAIRLGVSKSDAIRMLIKVGADNLKVTA